MRNDPKRFISSLIFLLLLSSSYIQKSTFAQSMESLLKPSERLSPSASFYGELNMGRLGYYLSRAGDVNGDGFDDFMIAGYHHHVHGWNSGGAYLFLGKSYIDWGLNGVVGQKASALFCGKQEYDFTGYNIDGGGDFNGDGFSDIVIGAPGNWDRVPPFPGKSFVVLGRPNADWGLNFVLEDGADEDFIGENDFDQFGYAVSFIGDINQDGFDEILCSAAFKNLQYSWQGKVYLIPGSADGYAKGALAQNEAIASFVYPADEAILGSAVAGVGDVNNDGIPDFAMGASGIGTVFLIFGRTEMDWGDLFDLHNADVTFVPEDPERDDSGWQVKGVDDVNGDQIDDFLISGLQIDNDAGKTHLIFGRENWTMSHYYLSQADASFLGEGAGQHSGVSINGVNDFNGDGYNDFMIGARYYSGGKYHRGKAYVVTGKSGGWQRNLPLSEIETYFVGEDTITCAGWGVSSAGDVNADGRMDILTSAPFSNEYDKWAGEIYLFLGDYNVLSLNGNVTCFNNQPIPNAAVTLSHTNAYETSTDNSGDYEIRVVPCNSATVSASKNKDEDVGAGSISAYDAALAARFAVGLQSLDSFQQMAADVSGDGDVQCFDAALIAHYAVGLNLVPSSKAGEWFFAPPSYFYEELYSDKNNVNFTGGILGDVDGNWEGAFSLTKSSEFEKSEILPKKIMVDNQSSIEIPLQLNNYKNVISADIEIEYAADLLKFSGIGQTSFSNNFEAVQHESSDGKLKIALYSMEPQNGAGEKLTLRFDVVNKKISGASKFALTGFRVNNFSPMTDETVLLFGQGAVQTKSVEIRNLPNPFNPSTTLHFVNETPGFGSIKIFDMLGRKVREFNLGLIQPGDHKILWDGCDESGQELASGVFFVQFNCGEHSILNKMIKIK